MIGLFAVSVMLAILIAIINIRIDRLDDGIIELKKLMEKYHEKITGNSEKLD